MYINIRDALIFFLSILSIASIFTNVCVYKLHKLLVEDDKGLGVPDASRDEEHLFGVFMWVSHWRVASFRWCV